MFDLYVVKQLPARRVAQLVGASVVRVYLAKHRVGAQVRKEVQALETQVI